MKDFIPSNQSIELKTRKDFYEVEEELTDSASWIITLWSIVYVIEQYVQPESYYFWFIVFFLTFWFILYSVIEFLNWYNEWHIITTYDNSSGGVYYKITGWVNQGIKDIPITPTLTPTVDEYEGNVLYWIFKKITGKRMQKVSLKTESHAFLSNTRMPPEFYKTLIRVRGSKPSNEEMPEVYKNIEAILKARQGNIVKSSFAEHVATAILSRLVE